MRCVPTRKASNRRRGASRDRRGAQAGFADGDAVVGNAVDSIRRMFRANRQRLEARLVYTQDARPAARARSSSSPV